MTLPRSILDLAVVNEAGDMGLAFAESVRVAQLAETSGYSRVWYAEHHNMASIASSATAVLIAHVAAHTSSIRLGSGGIMLPNHSPLVIAEQFGTLATLHPNRIDLGLGRAPGTDGLTFRALRRSHQAAENFPQDVIELGRYLGNDIPRTHVNAYPGRGTQVPLYILGSSMFGASLAAQLGLPYAFASHFAPAQMSAAISHYREAFVPSPQLERPYAMAALNVVAADTEEEAQELFERVKINRIQRFLSRGREQELTVAEAAQLSETPAGQEIIQMLRYTAIGDAQSVHTRLDEFGEFAQADELITVHPAPTTEERLTSVRLAAPKAP